MKKKNTEILLLASNYEYEYCEYVEWCNDSGIKCCGKDSHEFYEWCQEEDEINLECDKDLLSNCMYKDSLFVITGALGLWDGKHKIRPELVQGILPAINHCCNNEMFEAKLDTKTGVITVYDSHHDGTNVFEIHLVKDYCHSSIYKHQSDYQWGISDNFELKKGWFKKIHNPFA